MQHKNIELILRFWFKLTPEEVQLLNFKIFVNFDHLVEVLLEHFVDHLKNCAFAEHYVCVRYFNNFLCLERRIVVA